MTIATMSRPGNIEYRAYPYGKNHFVIIYPARIGDKSGFVYSLNGETATTGYSWNCRKFFRSEYEAFQHAIEVIDGPG